MVVVSPSILTRSKNRSSTNLLTTDKLQHDNNTTVQKDYHLNRGAALAKKKDSCFNNNLTWELKAKNNLVIKCSTVAFECVKQKLDDTIHSTSFQKEHSTKMETGKDLGNNEVEKRYRVFNRKKDGSQGTNLKFTINIYNSSSSILVNGMKIDVFMDSILNVIETTITMNAEHIDDMNNQLSKMIALENTHVEKPVKNQTTKSDALNDALVRSHNTATDMGSSKSNEADHEIGALETEQYWCPSCDQEAKMKTIACDEWYHYTCANLSEEDIRKLPTEFPYVCDSCNENQLYCQETSNGKQASPEEQTEKPTVKNTKARLSNESTCTTTKNKAKTNNLLESQNTTTANIPIDLVPPVTKVLAGKSAAEPKTISNDEETRPQLNSDSSKPSYQDPTLLSTTATPVTNLDRSTPVTHLDRSTPDMHLDISTQQKTKTAIKVKSVQKSAETRTLFIEMEKRLTEQQKTIELLEKRINLTSREESDTGRKTSHDCTCNQRASSIPEIDRYQQMQRQFEMQSMEARMRALETQSMQNMSIQTAMTTQLALQIQQQTIMMLRSQKGENPPHNLAYHTHPTGPFGPPLQPHQTGPFGPPPQNPVPPQPHYGSVQPQFGMPKSHFGPTQSHYGPIQSQYGPTQMHHGIVPNLGQPPPALPMMYQYHQPPLYNRQPTVFNMDSHNQRDNNGTVPGSAWISQAIPGDPTIERKNEIQQEPTPRLNAKLHSDNHLTDRDQFKPTYDNQQTGRFINQSGEGGSLQDKNGVVSRSAWISQATPGGPSLTKENMNLPIPSEPSDTDEVGRDDRSAWISQPKRDSQGQKYKANEQTQHQQNDTFFPFQGVKKPPDVYLDRNRSLN